MAFRPGQQFQQGPAHAAGKKRPDQALQHNGQSQGAQKEFKIKVHVLA